MKHEFRFAVMVLAGLGALGQSGCVHFHDQPTLNRPNHQREDTTATTPNPRS